MTESEKEMTRLITWYMLWSVRIEHASGITCKNQKSMQERTNTYYMEGHENITCKSIQNYR